MTSAFGKFARRFILNRAYLNNRRARSPHGRCNGAVPDYGDAASTARRRSYTQVPILLKNGNTCSHTGSGNF